MEEGSWGFGIVRANELEDAGRGAFEELCEAATAATGIPLTPYIATTYDDLLGGLEHAELAVAWLPPVPTIELESRQLGTALAIPSRNGATTYHAALLVRRGGPKTVAELSGRRVAWVQRDSASGYIIPRMQLAAMGFDVLRFFSREIFVHSHTRVVDAVVNGEADVGATYCHVDAQGKVMRGAWIDDEQRLKRPVEVLSTFGPVPNDALVASSQLSATARSALARWILNLDAPSRVLFERVVGASEFRVPSPEHFAPLRHTLRVARARGHDAMPSSSRMGIRAARRST